MAKARMYGWSEKRFDAPKKVAELKGQAGVVRDVLDAMHNEAHDTDKPTVFLANDIAAAVDASGKLVTRQSVERVTLYYILVLKKKGFIVAAEAPIDDEPEGMDDGTENIEQGEAPETAETIDAE